MISGGPHLAGTSRGAQKRYVNELKAHNGEEFIPEQRLPKQQRLEKQPIIFTEDDAGHVQFPHNDPLVVAVQLANRRVRRVLIDNGSSVNLLFRSTLEKMDLTVAELKATSMMLYGFSGKRSVAIGTIKLVITLGEGPRTVSKLLEFVVIDCSTAYNAILG